MGTVLYFMVFLLIGDAVNGNPVTTSNPVQISSPQPLTESNKPENRSVSDMVMQQTETVKKIVSDQQIQFAKQQDYPVITKYDVEFKDGAKKEMDRQAFEELKIKCQHFAKLYNSSRLHQERPVLPQKVEFPIGYRPIIYEQKRRPVYVPPIPTKYPTKNAFYITTHGPTTQRPVLTTTPPVATNVKYIRLEPVILQKTILSDGRTVYYWHKSLPSAVAYPAPHTVPYTPRPTDSSTVNDLDESSTEYQTTSSYYNRYDFRNFFTFYRSPSTTTERPTTTSSTTTISPDLGAPLFQNQLRFVVPVPYDSSNGAPVKSSWGFDEFAYYPKDLQPSTVNVQVPYSPNFHVIKALAVPNKYTQTYKEVGLDNVAV